MYLRVFLASAGVASAALAGCMDSGSGAALPLLSPPVRTAAPAGFVGRSRPLDPVVLPRIIDDALRAPDVRDRFFGGTGSTDVMAILDEIDQHLADLNLAGHRPPCLEQAPVHYQIAPFGHAVQLSAQCFRHLDTGFLQFGRDGDAVSLYIAVGATRFAAVVAPIDGAARYQVDAWYGVGHDGPAGCGATGTFDGCSYAVTQLHANPASRTFEMSVAGVGIGFCGLQFASKGAALYGVGSVDAGTRCNDVERLCVSASDLTTPGSCGSPAYLLPALGRRAGAGALAFEASRYPVEPNITLDGTPADSLHFGPLAPGDGVGDFDAP